MLSPALELQIRILYFHKSQYFIKIKQSNDSNNDSFAVTTVHKERRRL